MTILNAIGATRFGAGAKRFASLLVPGTSEIRQHRPVFAPLAAAWLLSLASAYALLPFVAVATSGEQAAFAEVLIWLGALAGPVLNGIKALLFAALAWAILVLTNTDRPFRRIFSLLLYGEAILAAHGIATAVLLRFTSDGATASPQDLQAGLGLGALVPPTRPVLAAAAQGVTLLHAAWFAFLFKGFRRVVDLGRWSAAGLAALLWFILVALGMARLFLL